MAAEGPGNKGDSTFSLYCLSKEEKGLCPKFCSLNKQWSAGVTPLAAKSKQCKVFVSNMSCFPKEVWLFSFKRWGMKPLCARWTLPWEPTGPRSMTEPGLRFGSSCLGLGAWAGIYANSTLVFKCHPCTVLASTGTHLSELASDCRAPSQTYFSISWSRVCWLSWSKGTAKKGH